MNYGRNVRSRNTKLQVRQSGIVVSHRIELSRTYSLIYEARDERRQAVLTTKLASALTLTVMTSGCASRSASDQSVGSCGLCGTQILPQRTRCFRELHP
jgi:hypothetical protein